MRIAPPPRDPSQVTVIHGEFSPVDVRAGESVQCRVKGNGESVAVNFTVWRLSPFGLELVETEKASHRCGDQVVVYLVVAGKETIYRGTVVASGLQESARTIMGIRLDTSPKAERKGEEIEQRSEIRWQSHRLFYPTGVATNRARFNDKIMFRVSDISVNGMRLVTSLRNKFLQVGVGIQATIQVPAIGEFSVAMQVVHIDVTRDNGEAQQLLGVKLLRPSKKCLASLGQYILQFGGDDKVSPSPRLLAEQGFFVESVADALDYDVVRTDDEYQQVLKLRSIAFQGVEGLGVSATPEQMADVYDVRSRILICRYRNQVVATTRLCFHGPDEQFEEEKYVQFPDDFPPRHLVVEASRAATHPDFRGSDLFLNIFRYVMLVTLQSGRRWIVQSTYGRLVPVYEKVGFRQTGLRCPHPVFPGEKLHLLLGDCQSVLNGRVGSILTWNTLVPEIQHLIEGNESIQLGWIARKRLATYQALTPLYKYYEKKKIERRMKRNSLR